MFPRPRSIIKFPDSARNRNPEEYKGTVFYRTFVLLAPFYNSGTRCVYIYIYLCVCVPYRSKRCDFSPSRLGSTVNFIYLALSENGVCRPQINPNDLFGEKNAYNPMGGYPIFGQTWTSHQPPTPSPSTPPNLGHFGALHLHEGL